MSRTPLYPLPRPSVSTQILEIQQLMADGQWTSGQADVLAAKWGVQRTTVLERAAEASRMLGRHIDKDCVRGLLLATIARIQSSVERHMDDPAFLAVGLRSVDLTAKLCHLYEPDAEQTTRWASMSRADKLARLAAMRDRIEREQAALTLGGDEN